MDQKQNVSEHWLTMASLPFDRTGGELCLKAVRGMYKITIENKITDYYETLLTTTKTTMARHCFETIYHAIADDELRAANLFSPERDHISAIASELSVSLK